jgi:excinuclease ABC subunit C
MKKKNICSRTPFLETIRQADLHEEILVPFTLIENLEGYKITIPKTGDKKKLLDLALKNAFHIKQNELKRNTAISNEERVLHLMKEDLKLKDLPFQIECFDNSNIQGNFLLHRWLCSRIPNLARMITGTYNVKTVEGPNDFASMEEIVYRRYKSLLEDNLPLPQLIVIDGGKGQLSSAMKSIESLGIEDKVQVISIAKRLEEIYYPNDSYPLHISKKSETLKVLAAHQKRSTQICYYISQKSKIERYY